MTAISEAVGDFTYSIYNDYSSPEVKKYLTENSASFNYRLINIEELTTNPSPNYRLTLQLAQKEAIHLNVPLIIIESDVIVKPDTIKNLIALNRNLANPGLIGAVTTDENSKVNFPYLYASKLSATTQETKHSISFCCTIISEKFLQVFDFESLDQNKDWYDVFISRQSRKLGFKNYISMDNPVIHLPHSSRPWKLLKYSNPLKYYFIKFFKQRDRI